MRTIGFWCVLATLCLTTDGHLIDLADDMCVDRAYQRWYTNMISKFSRYAEFISSMSQSRTLFQALFTQDFTQDSYKAFCNEHEQGRNQYDKCADTDARTLADIEFALADHVCIKRAEIFSRHIQCLQTNNVWAFQQCRNQCKTYEENSNRYAKPSQSDLRDQSMNWLPYMASDCQYLKCMTDCRKPIFLNKCNDVAAGLELDALKAAFAKKINYYDPPMLRSALQDTPAASMLFPQECEILADDQGQK